MTANTRETKTPAYQTITGRNIALTPLTEAEHDFLAQVAKRYGSRQDWTRFAAWWNAAFTAAGLSTSSVVYRLCQDLEARLGISQGKVSPPDYRDFLAELIDTQYGSRVEFCKATAVDPGQLSRVLAGRADLSMKVLQKILEMFHAHLVIQTEAESHTQTSIEQAATALAAVVASDTRSSAVDAEAADETRELEMAQPLSTSTVQQLIDAQLRPLREQVERLESTLLAAGVGSK